MEKEKKKLLLVAVTVGVFLAIIISAAVLILMPKTSMEGTAFSSTRPIPAGQQPASVDPADLVRNNDSIRGIQQGPAANANQENNFYINGDPNEERNDSQVVINIPRPSAAAVPDTQAPAPRSSAKPASPAAPAAAVARTQPASKPASSASSAPAAPAASAPAKARNDFWVQTGAFTAKVRAENVKETLATKGITSIIENREVDGKVWYRVRVGPYTSETEANYWLALVKSIDGFAESQVRQTVSAR